VPIIDDETPFTNSDLSASGPAYRTARPLLHCANNVLDLGNCLVESDAIDLM